MHLWWDSKLNQIVLVVISLLLLMLFIGFAIMDSHQYQPILEPPGAYSDHRRRRRRCSRGKRRGMNA